MTHQKHSGIPADIAFLAYHGVPPSDLRYAAQCACQWQVPAAEAVLALGLVDENELYRALAKELEIPFLPSGIKVSNDAPFPHTLRLNTLPLAPNPYGLHYAISPDGQAIEALFQHRYRLQDAGFAVTTPHRMIQLATDHFKQDFRKEASQGLINRTPHMSFYGGTTPQQKKFLRAFSLVLILSFLVTPVTTIESTMLAFAAILLTAIILRLSCCLEKAPKNINKHTTHLLSDAEVPIYTILIPLYREVKIVPQMLKAMRELDYPPAKLDIIFLLEEDDTATRMALESHNPPSHFRILVTPEGKPKTKPRALNMGLMLARGRYVVVYDAEDIPAPLQLRLAATLFHHHPDVACLQAHLVIDNDQDGLLPSLFAAEYAALFEVINPGLTAAGLPLLLGGTSNHIRTRILHKIGGWDAWNVTEDADLGLRLARYGLRVMDMPSFTREEAPITLKAWVKQRSRWMKGWMQVCITHARYPMQAWRDLGSLGFLHTMSVTLGTITSALFLPFLLPTPIWLLSHPLHSCPEWHHALILGISYSVCISGMIALILPIFLGLWRQRRLKLLWTLPFLPAYFLLLTLAAWIGLYELIVAPHYWHKTKHGISQRRFSPLKDD